MSDDLRLKLKAAAARMVGNRALTSKFGLDCFALVDTLLRSIGAETAADGDVPVTAKADYDWGDGIMLDSIRPGDILQFRKHVVQVQTLTFANGKWHETEMRMLTRPHHTAIVLEVHKDGSVTVVEQNVHPNPRRVNRNVIPKLDPGEKTNRVSSELKTTITVTGAVSAYRPVLKAPQGASILHPGRPGRAGASRRFGFNVTPVHGGVKRVPGPLGVHVGRPDDAGHA